MFGNGNHFESRGPARVARASRAARVLALGAAAFAPLFAAAPARAEINGEEMAKQVTINRDDWGVPHIKGPTDASVVFGFAYSQAEDFFWQVEDSYIMALGRYAEVNGESGLENDLSNRAFEIVPESKKAFDAAPPEEKIIAEAFAAGINLYLKHHPETQPRLLTHWEPYYVLAYERNTLLQFLYGKLSVGKSQNVKNMEEWRSHIGSNAWAIAPSRTASGEAMLFANPHQPYFGYGQFIEGHLYSDEGLNTSGASLIGGPLITIGHNEFLGWTHTVNEPDTADSWIETFDKADDKLAYKYGDEYRKATEWKEVVRVKTKDGMQDRTYPFRKTHHGPIIGRKDDTHFYAGKIAQLHEGNRGKQALAQGKARNLKEFQAAMAQLSLEMFNTIYADKEGNIWYLYNGTIPKRDLQFDWEHPVDGGDPRTEWQGLHPMTELPQMLNPATGFIQNCNSTPFMTSDDNNPFRQDFPEYMVGEKYDDTRRAKASRYLLRGTNKVTFEDWQTLCFDSTLYWALNEVPKYAAFLENEVRVSDPKLYEAAKPYMDHLSKGWDYKSSITSTQSTLCVEWYSLMYDGFYPAENFKKPYIQDKNARIQALIDAAKKLEQMYGNWKMPWGEIYRMQRMPNVADILKIQFKDDQYSEPSAMVNGPLGVAYTGYYTPPFLGRKKRYAVVGSSYMGVYEFTDRIKAKSLLQFGQRCDPKSPHYMDQAKLMGEKQFKPAYFYWDDVEAHTVEKYHPGEEAPAKAAQGQ